MNEKLDPQNESHALAHQTPEEFDEWHGAATETVAGLGESKIEIGFTKIGLEPDGVLESGNATTQ